jgi:hypothetical protein
MKTRPRYRIKIVKELFLWKSLDQYAARDSYHVQGRWLWVFWVTLQSFWDKDMAQSYFKALIELHANTSKIFKEA